MLQLSNANRPVGLFRLRGHRTRENLQRKLGVSGFGCQLFAPVREPTPSKSVCLELISGTTSRPLAAIPSPAPQRRSATRARKCQRRSTAKASTPTRYSQGLIRTGFEWRSENANGKSHQIRRSRKGNGVKCHPADLAKTRKACRVGSAIIWNWLRFLSPASPRNVLFQNRIVLGEMLSISWTSLAQTVPNPFQ